ncbi:MAG: hypothetical protein BECKG1743D_GA0114223_101277 [Candidatus Kentron sp. G]|nr:MAG: hypothetical protein BECKG1743E_GA0114224_101018 [Candidatus Kentron sp. G]VFM99505.1 MAG: hypothetical protein BECKG1743D_GA0114223_101277 [Candidatus Kentron sp. G]
MSVARIGIEKNTQKAKIQSDEQSGHAIFQYFRAGGLVGKFL